jgi:hypothetical protein
VSQPRVVEIAQIDADWSLAADGLQWILRRRRGKGGHVAWRDVSFVSSSKDTLARCMREKGVPVPAAAAVLAGLPDMFARWRDGPLELVRCVETAPPISPADPAEILAETTPAQDRGRA